MSNTPSQHFVTTLLREYHFISSQSQCHLLVRDNTNANGSFNGNKNYFSLIPKHVSTLMRFNHHRLKPRLLYALILWQFISRCTANRTSLLLLEAHVAVVDPPVPYEPHWTYCEHKKFFFGFHRRLQAKDFHNLPVLSPLRVPASNPGILYTYPIRQWMKISRRHRVLQAFWWRNWQLVTLFLILFGRLLNYLTDGWQA